jgi:hypothetical protein
VALPARSGSRTVQTFVEERLSHVVPSGPAGLGVQEVPA